VPGIDTVWINGINDVIKIRFSNRSANRRFFSSVFSNEVNEKLNGGFKQLNDTIDGINTGLSTKLSGIDGLNSKIEGISTEINGLNGGINESLKSDTVLTKIDGLASEINGIKGGLSETINTKIDGLREGYETLSSKLNERLIPDNTDFGEIKETLDSIKRQVGDLSLAPAPVAPLPGDGAKTTSNVEDIFQKVKKLQINT
jgi:archaellum component FlaC